MVVARLVAVRAGSGYRRMIGPDIVTAFGFVVMLLGFAFGVWKYIDGKVNALRLEAAQKAEAAAAVAALARSDLAAYKTHVAEVYVTKQGMHEQTEQLLRAMESIGARIDALAARMDGWFKAPTRRS